MTSTSPGFAMVIAFIVDGRDMLVDEFKAVKEQSREVLSLNKRTPKGLLSTSER
jgi:hypothetical protein